MTMTNDECHSSLGCHVAVSNMAPGFHIRQMTGRQVSLLTWGRCHLCSLVDDGEQRRRTTNVARHSSFGYHVAVSDVAPG
jgi:hypothetical protein